MNYLEFQERVFSHLWARNQQDKNFTFSVRQKASKGAETNYFIGTAQSRYFGFTFWDTPVYYPGSSSDLTDFIFWEDDGKLFLKFQYVMSKTEYDEQSIGDIELGREILKLLNEANTDVSHKRDSEKGLSFEIQLENGANTVEELLTAFDTLYSRIAPIVDQAIANVKARRPDWVGGRYSEEKFDKLIAKMHARIKKYSTTIDNRVIESISVKPADDFIPREKLPLNIVLYGPPGTGKTYHTINKALEIVDSEFYLKNENSRDELIRKFRSLQIDDWSSSSGQIAFTTFHQSMSYEDFVEGIKPLKPKVNEGIKYDIEDGIFKRICKLAQSNYESSQKENSLLPFEEVFEQFKDEWENNPELKFPLKSPGYEFTITGFTNTSIQFRKSSGGTSHTLSINTLKEQYYGKEYNFKQGVGIYYPPILNRLLALGGISRPTQQLNYVLIIDEINRGNVSQIFGELITLVEEDKRMGRAEGLQTILPYSKESFTVPPNVYIVGTMNTADRSVEALDTALRRRFSFQEMMPQEELLSPQKMILRLYKIYKDSEWEDQDFRAALTSLYELVGIEKEFEATIRDERGYENETLLLSLKDDQFKGINLEKCLGVINNRLVKLLSKDHQLGHAFFMDVFSIEDLYSTFFQKIIPQLQEYFYGDFGKIGLVLGSAFVEESDSDTTFAKFNYEEKDLLLDRKIYYIKSFLKEDQPDMDSFQLAVKAIYSK